MSARDHAADKFVHAVPSTRLDAIGCQIFSTSSVRLEPGGRRRLASVLPVEQRDNIRSSEREVS